MLSGPVQAGGGRAPPRITGMHDVVLYARSRGPR